MALVAAGWAAVNVSVWEAAGLFHTPTSATDSGVLLAQGSAPGKKAGSRSSWRVRLAAVSPVVGAVAEGSPTMMVWGAVVGVSPPVVVAVVPVTAVMNVS